MHVLFDRAHLPEPVELAARAYLADPPATRKDRRIATRASSETLELCAAIARARGWTFAYLVHHGLELVAAEALGTIGPRGHE